jgi:hypothetical protein
MSEPRNDGNPTDKATSSATKHPPPRPWVLEILRKQGRQRDLMNAPLKPDAKIQ